MIFVKIGSQRGEFVMALTSRVVHSVGCNSLGKI